MNREGIAIRGISSPKGRQEAKGTDDFIQHVLSAGHGHRQHAQYCCEYYFIRTLLTHGQQQHFQRNNNIRQICSPADDDRITTSKSPYILIKPADNLQAETPWPASSVCLARPHGELLADSTPRVVLVHTKLQ